MKMVVSILKDYQLWILISGVPGTVAGLWEVHKNLALYHGRLYLKMQLLC